MGDDGVPQVIVAAPGSTETSPLLGTEAIAASAGIPSGTSENGTERGSAPAADGTDQGDAGEKQDVWTGMPEVAARLHILGPAIGIGVFLCALDQLLVVATYAKIGSDLNALNNTSWIATA